MGSSPSAPSSSALISTATIASKELTATRAATVEEALDAKRPMCSFEPTESTKEILVDPTGSDGKVLHIGLDLLPK
jgi:hypothetical protein